MNAYTQPTIRMSAEQRGKFRKDITSHPDWNAKRKSHGWSIAEMTLEQMIDCAKSLGINPTLYGQVKGDYQHKPRPYGPEAFYEVNARINACAVSMSDSDASYLRKIIDTVQNKQDRYMTQGQKDVFERVLARYENKAESQSSAATYDGSTVPADMAKALFKRWMQGAHYNPANMSESDYDSVCALFREHYRTGQPMPVGAYNAIEAYMDIEDMRHAAATQTDSNDATQATQATQKDSSMFDTSSTGTATNDAASQLATLLGQLAGQAMNPEQIARVVDERITKALAGIPTVKFEVKGFDGQTRDVGGHKHPKFAALLQSATARLPNGYAPNLWVAGPTGSGKTHACQMLAQALGLPFYVHGATAMAHELLGYQDAGGTYHSTQFRQGFEDGGVVVVDEIDAWGSEAYLALNSMTSNGIGVFPDKQVQRHENCIIVACANTWGLGATSDYVGRNKIDAAFLSRFAVRIDWPYDTALEIAISGNESWANRVIAARNRAKQAGLKVIICPRITLSGAALLATGMKADTVAELTYLANVTPEQAKVIEGK